MGIGEHLYRTTVAITGVAMFYILSSVDHDITKDPFEKLAQLRDWASGKKPVEAPVIDTHSHH